jgi:hypothetical protein
MIKLVKFIWSRRVIFYIVFIMLACPLLFALGAFSPENMSFLEPVLCPPGMHLDQVTESQTDLQGTVIALNAVCTDGEEKVNATGKLALFVCGAPILIGVLLVLPAFFSPSKKQEDSAGSEE